MEKDTGIRVTAMGKIEKTVKDAEVFASMVAKKQGWALNPDRTFLDDLFHGLAKNFNRYGYYSCPCRDASGSRDIDSDIICPCQYCRPDQEEYGYCYCALYLTREYAGSGRVPSSLPERRPS